MKAGLALLLCACLIAAAGAAQAQEDNQRVAYCNLTDVQVEVLSNAVRITIVADGTVDYDRYPDWTAYYDYDPKRDSYTAKHLRRFSILLTNARNQLGWSVKDISRYPFSHIEVSVPPESITGVGVVLTLETFDPMYWWEVRPHLSRDRRRLIITGMSDRHYEVGKKEEAVEKEEVLRLETEPGRLRLHAANVDLRLVAARLSEAGQVAIAVDDAVQRKVTAYLEQPNAEAILRLLCQAYALTMVPRDSGYYVTDPFPVADDKGPSPAAYGLSTLHEVPLRHLGARAARALLPDVVVPYVRPNEEANSLSISGPEAFAEKVASDVRRLDQPGPVLELAVDVVEFLDQRLRETALYPSWRAGGQEQSWDTGEGTITIETGLVPGRALALRLHALERQGKAHLVTHATLRALNGQPAELFVGQEKFILVYERWSTAARIVPVDVGVRLNTTGWTSGQTAAYVDLSVRVTTILSTEPETGLPELGVREARAKMLVRLGQTIAIGGFTLEHASKSETTLAPLADLPLIGWLFRQTSEERVRNRLVMLVTPRVVGAEAASEGARLSKQRRLLEEGIVR